MLLLLLWITSFVFFSLVGALVLFRIFGDKIQIRKRISPLLAQTSDKLEGMKMDESSLKERIFEPVMQSLHAFILRKTPRQKLKALERKLSDAGHPFGLRGVDYYIVQFIISALFVSFILILFLPKAESPSKIFLLAIFSVIFVIIYSNYYLNAKSKQRIQKIEQAMPDFFDMVNVSIEAGMGLDGALKRVCKQMEGPLSEEFTFAIEDMRLGKSRKQAFSELRERVSSGFFKSVISALIQADQMGIGMTKVLRAQTQRIREQQRQKSREQAMKAPVKMMLPMVLFIFPTLFIILLGPVVIQLVTNWL